MASSSLTAVRMSRDDFKKARELEELRKTGAAPPELDPEGNMINPHIPQYISQSPWYLNDARPGLKHQKSIMFQGSDDGSAAKGSFGQHYQRGRVAAPAATKFVAGACTNCGATSHKTKDCCERPRKKGAALTGRDIMPDEHIQKLEFSYDGKRDRWNGYDTKEYSKVIRRFEVTELERKKKKLQELDEAFELEKQEERRKKEEEERKANEPADAATDPNAAASAAADPAAAAAAVLDGAAPADVATDARRLRALKKQEKLKKMIRRAQKDASANNAAAAGGGGRESDSDSDSDGSDEDEDDMRDLGEAFTKKDSQARMTVRNLRIREDTPKYLRNLDLNSAHYDPKTRSMRDNPYEGIKDPHDVMYAGDNFVRKQGATKDIQQLQSFVWESVERGNEGVHVQALPSQAEKLFADYRSKKEALAVAVKTAIHDKYVTKGSATAQQQPRELLVPTSEAYVEYDETGAVVKGAEKAAPRTKYPEDVFENGHKTIWGSFYKPGATSANGAGQWGYACCHQTIRHSICTGEAGKAALADNTAMLGQRASFKEREVEREKAAAATAAASAAAAAASSAAAAAAAASSSAAAPAASSSSAAASSMDTSADLKREQREKRKRRERSRSRSSSSSSSSGSDSDSDSDSSSSSGSSSSSDSDSSSARRRRRKEKKRSSNSRSSKSKSSSSSSKSSSKKPRKEDSASAATSSSKPTTNAKGYNSLAGGDAEPTERELDLFHLQKSAAGDPMRGISRDQLLDA